MLPGRSTCKWDFLKKLNKRNYLSVSLMRNKKNKTKKKAFNMFNGILL